MNIKINHEQGILFKEAHAINNLRLVSEKLGISYKTAFNFVRRKRYIIKLNYKKIKASKPYNMQMQADLIEDFLTGNYTLNELGLKYNTYATRISYIISKYFPYKGYDGVCITLGSKV